MPALYNFKNRKYPTITISYDPDDNVLYIRDPSGAGKQQFDIIANHLQTILNTSVQGRSLKELILKIDGQADISIIQGSLRSKGYEVVAAKDDAASIADDNAKKEVDEKMMTAQAEQSPVATENSDITNAYGSLFESTYRTGKYWQDLVKPAGTPNKQAISPEDVIRVRKIYTRKPKSKTRDSILRSLDKAYKYFFRVLDQKENKSEAKRFKQKYKSIGHLVANDYSKDPELKPEEETPFVDPQLQQEPAPIDIASLINNASSVYDDIDYDEVDIEN